MTALEENTKIKTLTGAEIIVETLENLGVNSIFGYPGGVILGVYDELYKRNSITHYLVRHEQAAVHAAEGYARYSGKCGFALVTSGPGAANTVSALANAFADGYPVMLICGQVKNELLGKNSFGEINITDITKTCTKASFQVTSAQKLHETLIRAYNIAMSGKKGPVIVAVTKDVLTQTAEFSAKSVEIHADEYHETCDINNAPDLICRAKRPVILSGGGVVHSDARDELVKLVSLLNIPVVNTLMGTGTFPKDNKNYTGMVGLFGNPAANQIIRESDLIFAIGTRLNNRVMCCFKNNEFSDKLVCLNIDEKEVSNSVKPLLTLRGDAKKIIKEMTDELKKTARDLPDISDWNLRVSALKKLNPKYIKKSDKLHSFEVIEEINRFIRPLKPVITTEVGQHQIWAARILDIDNPHKFITSGGTGTMGFGLPACVGASVACGNGLAVCIAGDGSLQMNIQELATLAQYNLPVKIMVLNNGYLGMVRQLQEAAYGNRITQTEILNPDFVKLANSYGITAFRVDKKEDIKSVLEKVFSTNSPVLTDFIVEPDEIL